MGETSEKKLELDELGERLDAFYVLRKVSSPEADKVLSDLGADDEVDRDIVLELAGRRSLGYPDRFAEAHSIAVRSLEVLDRNGTRGIDVPGWLGPLKPVAGYLVKQVTGYIVRSHLRSVIDNLRRLYTRREANCRPGAPERKLLTRARIHAERLTEGFKKNPLGVPGFVLGGAFLSFLVGVVQNAVGVFGSSWVFRILAIALVFGIFALASWMFLKGAAVAHRRINLTTERPLKALYETIGLCGNPPGSGAKAFAYLSILFTALALIVIPIGLAVFAFR